MENSLIRVFIMNLMFTVLEPVTLEYQTLRDKYEIARQCQFEAENYASKVSCRFVCGVCASCF